MWFQQMLRPNCTRCRRNITQISEFFVFDYYEQPKKVISCELKKFGGTSYATNTWKRLYGAGQLVRVRNKHRHRSIGNNCAGAARGVMHVALLIFISKNVCVSEFRHFVQKWWKNKNFSAASVDIFIIVCDINAYAVWMFDVINTMAFLVAVINNIRHHTISKWKMQCTKPQV